MRRRMLGCLAACTVFLVAACGTNTSEDRSAVSDDGYSGFDGGAATWDASVESNPEYQRADEITSLLEAECLETTDWSDLPHCQDMFGGSSASGSTYSSSVMSSGCASGCTEHKSGCDIKGNISVDSGEKIYHVPGQTYYSETKISPEYGERWFCTEAEAIANGWRKAKT
jgi:hypothetical protein